jgi:hypothetical protein
MSQLHLIAKTTFNDPKIGAVKEGKRFTTDEKRGAELIKDGLAVKEAEKAAAEKAAK